MTINLKDLERVVEANKLYRLAQLQAYYGNRLQDVDVSECTDMERLRDISEATGTPIRPGMRHADGTPSTMVLVWNGCRFWAPSDSIE